MNLKKSENKKEFVLIEVERIEFWGSILRSNPQIPFDVANDLNGIVIQCRAIVSKFKEFADLHNERLDAALILTDDAEREKAIKDVTDTRNKKDKEKYQLDFKVLSIAKETAINGDKEVPTQSGIIKHNYRDAYFELRSLGVFE